MMSPECITQGNGTTRCGRPSRINCKPNYAGTMSIESTPEKRQKHTYVTPERFGTFSPKVVHLSALLFRHGARLPPLPRAATLVRSRCVAVARAGGVKLVSLPSDVSTPSLLRRALVPAPMRNLVYTAGTINALLCATTTTATASTTSTTRTITKLLHNTRFTGAPDALFQMFQRRRTVPVVKWQQFNYYPAAETATIQLPCCC